jgi:hypothetical protein
MFNQTGYNPVHSSHISTSEVCATCHTLFTPFVDDNGEVAGTFPEQTPYLEWKNSSYPEQNIECQTCHMPAVDEAIKIAARPPWLPTQRQPVWKHDFVGGNSFMVSLIQQHAGDIGAAASPVHFDSTLAKEEYLLKNKTVELEINGNIENDSLFVWVTIKNLAGHKFPTGFPSRRAWLNLVVTNQNGETVFSSGEWDERGEIVGLDEPCEPHHNVITSADQVQIYESIMQDVNGDITFTLLRGADYKKDNRLPPVGFTSTHEEYTNISITGMAATDDNFNQNSGEGSGTDVVLYKISVQDDAYSVTVRLLYQTLSPRFYAHLASQESAEIRQFQQFYEQADRKPVMLKEKVKQFVATTVGEIQGEDPLNYALIRNYPNPFNANTLFEFHLPQSGTVSIDLYDQLGQLVRRLAHIHAASGWHRISWDGRDDQNIALSSGLYYAKMAFGDQSIKTRILLLR